MLHKGLIKINQSVEYRIVGAVSWIHPYLKEFGVKYAYYYCFISAH